MKRIIFSFFATLLFTLISYVGFSQTRLGAGLAYGSEIERIGAQLRIQYEVTEKVGTAVDFTYFFPEKVDVLGTEIKASFNTLNANIHYVLTNSETFFFYPVAGVNFAVATVKFGDESESDLEIGFNVGAGARLGLSDSLSAFGEAKYVIGEADQAVINVGVLFNL